MKTKNSLVQNLLAIIGLVLTIIILLGNADSKVITPYIITCLGILTIFEGLDFYKQDRKTDGIFSIICGISILSILVKFLIS